MSRVRTLLAFVVGAVLTVPLVLIGETLDFGGLAYLAGLVVVLVLASLGDREGFYGPRESR
jgi:peptidoglycan/LPS O-acetylase OafA/YrhL